jgi:hypothetical protein
MELTASPMVLVVIVLGEEFQKVHTQLNDKVEIGEVHLGLFFE